MKLKSLPLIIVTALTLYSCIEDKQKKGENDIPAQPSVFSLIKPEDSGITFSNEIENQTNFNIFQYRNFYNGGGVAIGDINNDGLSDIYFTANMGSNKLYLNKGNLKFEDITASAGVAGNKPWSTGVVMADVNADGYLDIYVSNAGNLKGNNHNNDLYINNGDGTFSEKAEEYNLAKTGFSTQASFFDYDNDGDLDVYILNNSNIPVSSLGNKGQRTKRAQNWDKVDPKFRGVGDLLMRNDNGVFTDVSDEAGIYGSLIGFGLGVVITDINNDLWPDIYVSNDFFERDYLYINQKDGSFRESIKEYTSHLSLSAMGVDIADINNDGLQDIFITDMLPEKEERVKSVMEFDGYNVYKRKQRNDFSQQFIQNTLQVNNGNGTFSEVAYNAGVEATDWSWTGLIFDMDNDGHRDIYVTNGINHDLTDLDFVDFFANEIMNSVRTGKKQAIDSIINRMPVKPLPNYTFKNNGDITFDNVTQNWGMHQESMSNGAAYGDLDNDGDLDLVVNNVNMNAFVYRNNTQENTTANYLKVNFEGAAANPFAIGASIRIYANGIEHFYEHIPSRGFQSSMQYGIHSGLGNNTSVDSLRVIWPDHKTELIKNIKTNQTLTLTHNTSLPLYKPVKKQTQKTLFTAQKTSALIAHQENNYSDFDFEGLIAKQLSQEGPALAVGDVNGDGNQDIYLGGASGQAGQLYLHKGKGKLALSKQNAFSTDLNDEDTAAAFVDTDGDGDLDLIVASGGNTISDRNSYTPRLYINNGKGAFAKAKFALPTTTNNMSCIAPYDFDQDGDIDIFIGSRSIIGVYGISPEHLFLQNNGDGTFTNATEKIAYPTKNAGMITDAKWADVDGDHKKDLITTSDWGTVNIYRNNGRRLSVLKTNLEQYKGWWQTVTTADVDNDGDQDLILGNEGTNTHYRPTADRPMQLYVNDFDNNGTIEQITTQTTGAKDYPIHQKKELTAQLVSLKKQNLKASDYAKRSISELIPPTTLNNSIKREVNTGQSIVAVNDGKGQFTIKPLPYQVQLSCVCGIACFDINGDQKLDLVMGGNNFEFKPQYSQLDASQGHVLLGTGNGDFEYQDLNTTGISIRSEIKHISTFKDASGNTFIITAINNEKPRVYAQ